MKHEGTRESKGGQKATIHLVALGAEELRLIHEMSRNAFMNTPAHMLALQPTRQRLKSMYRTTGEILGIFKLAERSKNLKEE